jgi:hypothetical protein
MKNKRLYSVLQWTWGLPQTLIGAAVFVIHKDDPHIDYGGATATGWKRKDGVSLGKFIFVPKQSVTAAEEGAMEKSAAGKCAAGKEDRFLLEHEYGHTIQSLILGPAYLILVGLPSIIWSRLPYFSKMRKRTGRSYYSAVFERTASELGRKHARKA